MGGMDTVFFEAEGGGVSSYLRQKVPFRLGSEWKLIQRITSSTRSSPCCRNTTITRSTSPKISKKAGVSRATFYRIFQNKEDIIKAYFERSELKFLSTHSPLNPCGDPKEFIYFCFEKLGQEKANFLALYHQGLIHYLTEALNAGIEKDFAEHARGDKAAAYLYAGATANLEVYYLANGTQQTPERRTEELLRFLHCDRA